MSKHYFYWDNILTLTHLLPFHEEGIYKITTFNNKVR